MHTAYLALIRGDAQRALDTYRARRDRMGDDVASWYGYARLVCDLGSALASETDVFRELLPHAEYSFFATYQLVLRACETGVPLGDALVQNCQGANEQHKELIGELIAARSDPPTQGVRHVAICGVSFSGSTLIDRILNGLPGVASIGESHWLTKSYDGVKAGPLDLLNYPRHVPQCSVCGPGCKLLTREFRASLYGDPQNWYFKIAHQLGTPILVSADKNLPKIARNDPRLRCDALVLYKSPKRAWASVLSKAPKGQTSEFYLERMEKYLQVWHRSYMEILQDFRPQGEKLFVNFDDLTFNPALHVRTICEQLRLNFDASVLQRAVPGHSIGGNANAMRRLRAADYRVTIDPPTNAEIPAEHAAWIDAQPEWNDLFKEMNERAVRAMWSDSRGRTAAIAVDIATPPSVDDRAERTVPLVAFALPTIADDRLPGIFEPFSANVSRAAARFATDERHRLKRQFYLYLAERFGQNGYEHLQKRHLVEPHIGRGFNGLKYLDTAHWIGGKFEHAMALGLQQSDPLDVLDLGCGPGHFQVVCEFLGHRTVGLDVPLKPRIPTAKSHLYDELCEFFGVRKVPHTILAREPLPDLGKFELITAFMTAFDNHRDRTPWSPEDWSFFMAHLRDALLKPGGRVHLNLTEQAVPRGTWNFLAERATTVVRQTRTVTFEDLAAFSG